MPRVHFESSDGLLGTCLKQLLECQSSIYLSKFKNSRCSIQDVIIRHIGYPGYVYRKADCRDFGMPPASVSVEGPNSDGVLLSSIVYR